MSRKKRQPESPAVPAIDMEAKADAYRAVGEMVDTLRGARIELRETPAGSAAFRKRSAFVAELQEQYSKARAAY